MECSSPRIIFYCPGFDLQEVIVIRIKVDACPKSGCDSKHDADSAVESSGLLRHDLSCAGRHIVIGDGVQRHVQQLQPRQRITWSYNFATDYEKWVADTAEEKRKKAGNWSNAYAEYQQWDNADAAELAASFVVKTGREFTKDLTARMSQEVGPQLAHDTMGTLAEARELHERVDRQNLMIKVPATPEGVPAIEELIADGICVNVTLMFAPETYEAVAEAYLKGLERRAAENKSIREIASVASIFISRVDTKIDKLLEAKISETDDEAEKESLRSLIGKTAIANSKLMYERYLKIFGGSDERWSKLKAKGANPQRLLWASTSTKNPKLPDTYYVEALIGKVWRSDRVQRHAKSDEISSSKFWHE